MSFCHSFFSVCSKLICCYCWSCVLKNGQLRHTPMCSSITSTFWKCLVGTAISWRKFRCPKSIRMSDQPIRVRFEKISFSEKKNFRVFQLKIELTIYTSIICYISSWLVLFHYTFGKIILVLLAVLV
jgi:hypothetical protein